MTFTQTVERMKILEDEIIELKSRYTESGTGSLRTAVSTLEWRVRELESVLSHKGFLEG